MSTPPEQLEKLLEAGRKYRAFKYWDRIQRRLVGEAISPARDSTPSSSIRGSRRARSGATTATSGCSGAMHWAERRRFSLPEFKRFGSFPDEFAFAGEFEEGIRQIGNCVPPLFMRAIARHVVTAF